MKKVAAIIPALHRPDLTARCLDSLHAQTVGPELWEAIVVENDAQSGNILQDPLPANTRRILLDRNYGTTGAINRGAAASCSEYILLLNNDVDLQPEFLDHLLAAMQDPGCGFATGKMLQGVDTSIVDGAGDAMLQGGGAYRVGHGDRDCGQFDQAGFVLAGCGAATLVRRSAFEQVQGLDEDFFAYLDDLDLGLRLRIAGYDGVYIPKATARHLGSATLGDAQHPKIMELITRNQLLLILKDYPLSVLLISLPRVVVFQALWLARVIHQGAIRAYLRGFTGGLWRIPRMLGKRRGIARMRRISSRQFLTLLVQSEQQIHRWQTAAGRIGHSAVLRLYFRLFPARQEG